MYFPKYIWKHIEIGVLTHIICMDKINQIKPRNDRNKCKGILRDEEVKAKLISKKTQ